MCGETSSKSLGNCRRGGRHWSGRGRQSDSSASMPALPGLECGGHFCVFSGAFRPISECKTRRQKSHSWTLARRSQYLSILAKLLECACLFWRFGFVTCFCARQITTPRCKSGRKDSRTPRRWREVRTCLHV